MFFYQASPVDTSEGEQPSRSGADHKFSSKRETAKALTNALSADGSFPVPPQDYQDWLKDVKGLALPTRKIYIHEASHFLAYVFKLKPNEVPRLERAWDVNLCAKFFKELSKHVSPTTLSNYHSAMATVRQFLKLTGRKPNNYGDIQDSFKLLTSKAMKSKRAFTEKMKGKKSAQRKLLAKFHNDVYLNEDLRGKYNSIVNTIKLAVKAGKPVKLKRETFHFATSYMICITFASNFKRSGNVALISLEQARVSLNKALLEFRRRFPHLKLSTRPKLLDPRKTVPALLTVVGSKKKDEFEQFAIICPRDQRSILEYAEYIRGSGPCKPRADTLFINARGDPLGDNIWFYVDWIGKSVGINDLRVSTLRSLVETENVLEHRSFGSRLPGSSGEISKHLGHSVATAKRYYVEPDERHAVQAAFRIRFILEEAGYEWKPEASGTSETLWDPVSDSI